jgi:uncharacterized protein (TIRG00374 family)
MQVCQVRQKQVAASDLYQKLKAVDSLSFVRRTIRVLLRLSGLVILAVLFTTLDVKEGFAMITSVGIPYLVCTVLLFIPKNVLLVHRWRLLLEEQNISISFLDAFSIYFASFFTGFFTPGRVGEVFRIQYLKDKGFPYHKSLLTIFVERLFDLMLLMLLSIVGFQLLFEIPWIIAWGALTALVVATIYILAHKVGLTSLFRGTVERAVSVVIKGKAQLIVQDYWTYVGQVSLRKLWPVFGLTVFWWSLHFLQMYIVARALGIIVRYWEIALCLSLVSLFTMIPISFSGLGIREVSIMFLLARLGFKEEIALVYGITVELVLLVNLLFSFLVWEVRPIGSRTSRETLVRKEDAAG